MWTRVPILKDGTTETVLKFSDDHFGQGLVGMPWRSYYARYLAIGILKALQEPHSLLWSVKKDVFMFWHLYSLTRSDLQVCLWAFIISVIPIIITIIIVIVVLRFWENTRVDIIVSLKRHWSPPQTEDFTRYTKCVHKLSCVFCALFIMRLFCRQHCRPQRFRKFLVVLCRRRMSAPFTMEVLAQQATHQHSMREGCWVFPSLLEGSRRSDARWKPSQLAVPLLQAVGWTLWPAGLNVPFKDCFFFNLFSLPLHYLQYSRILQEGAITQKPAEKLACLGW